MIDEGRPERESAIFDITPPDDRGVHDVFARYYSGATTLHLDKEEMRQLAHTLATFLGEAIVPPNTLEAEVIRAAGAWVEFAETPKKSLTDARQSHEDLRDAVKDYRAGVSTK